MNVSTTTTTAVSVRMDDVSRRYVTDGAAIEALDEVTLEIPAGQVVGIAGPSGSGKSTLLHLVGAMDDPDDGTVLVGELDLGRLSNRAKADYRRTIGFVFQQFHLLPALTVLDNVVAPLIPYRVSFDKQTRARELLDNLGLGDKHRATPSKLSGGQQQRVAIARALINSPGLVLADEPTGNLDSTTGQQILDLLIERRDTHGTTTVITTHDPRVMERCDRIIRLADGRIVD